jgi:hypothetical protein
MFHGLSTKKRIGASLPWYVPAHKGATPSSCLAQPLIGVRFRPFATSVSLLSPFVCAAKPPRTHAIGADIQFSQAVTFVVLTATATLAVMLTTLDPLLEDMSQLT